MTNYQYKPPKQELPATTYRTPSQQTEKDIVRDNLMRQRRIRELEEQKQSEENQRIQKALQEKRKQVQLITEDARKAQRMQAKPNSIEQLEAPPDPKQEAFSDFQNFLNRVEAAAGIEIPSIQQLPAETKPVSRKMSARTPKPIAFNGVKDTLVLSPPQMLGNEHLEIKNCALNVPLTCTEDPIIASNAPAQASILDNPPELLIEPTQDSSYDFPLDASIKEAEKLEVIQLDYDIDDEEDKQRHNELVEKERQRVSAMTQQHGLSFSVVEQCHKFANEKARQEKVKEKLTRQPPKAPKNEDNNRLSLEIKRIAEEERKIEQEVMQIDEKLYNVEGLANCSLIERQNFVSPNTEGSSIFEAKQTEDEVVRTVAIYDADGNILNKDEVAKAISDFKRRQSRGIIEESVKGKVRKMMEVKKQKIQLPSPTKFEPPSPELSTIAPEPIQAPNQVAINLLFGNQEVDKDSKEHPSEEFDENAFFTQELANSIKQNDVYSTAPQVDLTHAIEVAQKSQQIEEERPRTALRLDPLEYSGQLNENYRESALSKSSDSEYGDIYASMNSVDLRRASVAHYEAECNNDDDDEYDFENM